MGLHVTPTYTNVLQPLSFVDSKESWCTPSVSDNGPIVRICVQEERSTVEWNYIFHDVSSSEETCDILQGNAELKQVVKQK